MFDGFEAFDIATTATTIHGRRGGQGPPVLLLHGMPETHLMWHRVAPRLAERFTVVAIDLRGFGDSGTPPSTPDHAPYSMREIATDQVEVMRTLGYDQFSVVGHDRGARCAYRMALDHPSAVTRLAVGQLGMEVLMGNLDGKVALVAGGTRGAVDTHLITSHFALPLLIRRRGGLVVEMTDGTADYNAGNYRVNAFYELVKWTVLRWPGSRDMSSPRTVVSRWRSRRAGCARK